MKIGKLVVSIFAASATAAIGMFAWITRPQPVSAVSTLSSTIEYPNAGRDAVGLNWKTGPTGANGYPGCVKVTVTIPVEPGEQIRTAFIRIAQTKETIGSSRILDGDPYGGNYWIEGSDYFEYGFASPPDNKGFRNWYLGLTWSTALADDYSFDYYYCGPNDVEIERNALFLNSDIDFDVATGLVKELDVHIPTGN